MFAGSNIKNFFLGGTRDREQRETRRAWEESQTFWQASPLARSDIDDLAIKLTLAAADRAERRPAVPILVCVAEVIERLLRAESIGDISPLWDLINADMTVGVEFRQVLARRRRWAGTFDTYWGAFSRIVRDNIDAIFSCYRKAALASGTWKFVSAK